MFKSKLIKLTIIMALLLNLLSGVVFAVEAIPIKIELDQDAVTFIEGFSETDVTGRVVNAETNALYAIGAELKLYKDANGNGVFDSQIDTHIVGALGTTVKNGLFSISILTNNQGQTGIGQYFVVGVDGASYHFTDYATFRIQYDISLENPATLEWVYDGNFTDQIVVKAVFRNNDNSHAASAITLRYQDGDAIATANYADQSAVGFLFNEEQLFKTGQLGLYIADVLAIEGEVRPQDLDMRLSPTELVANLGEVNLGFDFDLAAEFTQTYRAYTGKGVGLSAGYDLRLTLKIPDADEDMGLEQYVYDAYMFPEHPLLLNMSIGNYFEDGRIELPFNPRKEVYYFGEYELIIDLVDTNHNFIVQTTTRTLEIVEADEFNLVVWNDTALGVGDSTFYYSDRMADRSVIVLDELGLDYSESAEFQGLEITVSGCGVEAVYTTLAALDDGGEMVVPESFTIKPNVTGVIEVAIRVYEVVDNAFYGSALKTFKRELVVEGWNVQINPTTIDVGSEVDISISITDEDGNPINNAIITTADAQNVLVNGNKVNTIGGRYVIQYDDEKLSYEDVGKIDLQFWIKSEWEAAGDPEIVLEGALDVVGLNIYHVTANQEALLQGFEEEVAITALGFAYEVIYPIFSIDYYDEDGEPLAKTLALVNGERVDLDGDNINEAVTFSLTPPAEATIAVVKAESGDGKKYGLVEIPVYKPQVESAPQILTAFIETDWQFSIVDPRNGEILKNKIHLLVDNEYMKDLQYVQTLTYLEGEWFARTILPEVSFERAKEADESLYIEMYLDTATDQILLEKIPVASADLKSTPPGVILGTATTIEIAYLDAQGAPLSGYGVWVDDQLIGDTDAAGKIAFSTTTGTTQTIVVECATDVEGEVTTVRIASIIDLEPPKATVSESGKIATITITDNVRVAKALVNGQKVDIVFAQPTITYQTARSEAYVVRALDSNFNYSEITLAGTLPPPDPKVLRISIGEVTKYGTIELVNGTTVVPVRYAQELGATIEWDPDIKMVTYAVNHNGNRRISVVIDSTTALVNGKNVQMVLAPFINDKGRTMVPLRMIAQELGFSVDWAASGQITIR